MTDDIKVKVGSLSTRVTDVERRIGVVEQDRELVTNVRLEVKVLAGKIQTNARDATRDAKINRTLLLLILGGFVSMAFYFIQIGVTP